MNSRVCLYCGVMISSPMEDGELCTVGGLEEKRICKECFDTFMSNNEPSFSCEGEIICSLDNEKSQIFNASDQGVSRR